MRGRERKGKNEEKKLGVGGREIEWEEKDGEKEKRKWREDQRKT